MSLGRGALRAASATAVVTLLATAPAAAARIVPGVGMAGVSLRMTEVQVEARLGQPLQITRTRGALGFLVTRLHYPRLDVDLQRLASRPIVIRVLTIKPGERTASGVGVGSPLSDVKRLHGVRCWFEASTHYCGLGEDKPLRTFTLFWTGSNARVTLIEVSLNVNS
ncbi:MAG: hypothetical protein ACRDNM_00755 [Gaiellaceae bacterium]